MKTRNQTKGGSELLQIYHCHLFMTQHDVQHHHHDDHVCMYKVNFYPWYVCIYLLFMMLCLASFSLVVNYVNRSCGKLHFSRPTDNE